MNRRTLTALSVSVILAMAGCETKKPEPPIPAPRPELEAPALWGHLPPGDFWVGYRTVWMSDDSRPMPDGSARPIQVSVWYPAEPYPGKPPMTYRDYVALAASEKGSGPAPDDAVTAEVNRFLEQLEGADVPSEAAADLIGTELAARADIDAADGTFPLVLLAQGHGNSPWRQSVMCEFLASQGFVVITMASQARISGFPASEDEVLGKVEEQAGDLAFLAAHASDLSPVPTKGLGVIGYSFGARSALAATMKGLPVDALVSIDGGIGNAQGKELFTTAEWFDPTKMAAPLLHVYQPGDAVVVPDFEIIEKLGASSRLLVRVVGLKHGHFSNHGMLRTLGKGWDGVIAPDLDPQPAFEQTLTFVRAFLRAHLQEDPGELETLVERGAAGPVDEVRSITATE